MLISTCNSRASMHHSTTIKNESKLTNGLKREESVSNCILNTLLTGLSNLYLLNSNWQYNQLSTYLRVL